MAKLGLAASLFAIVAAVTLALSAAPVDAAQPCKRTTFQSTDVKAACKAGGQKAAKDQMKKFLKKAKATRADLDCKSCHTALAPSYALRDDAFKQYKALGGK